MSTLPSHSVAMKERSGEFSAIRISAVASHIISKCGNGLVTTKTEAHQRFDVTRMLFQESGKIFKSYVYYLQCIEGQIDHYKIKSAPFLSELDALFLCGAGAAEVKDAFQPSILSRPMGVSVPKNKRKKTKLLYKACRDSLDKLQVK